MSLKTIFIWMLVFIGFIIGLAFLLTAGQKPTPATANYTTAESDRPKVETDKTTVDLGTIKVSDVKVQEFALKNVGAKPLQILNVNSSCGCTAGQIIYNGEISREYSMHTQSGFVTEVAPGDTATVRLTYRPASMPVYGLVERAVFVETNDPANAKLTYNIIAKVE